MGNATKEDWLIHDDERTFGYPVYRAALGKLPDATITVAGDAVVDLGKALVTALNNLSEDYDCQASARIHLRCLLTAVEKAINAATK